MDQGTVKFRTTNEKDIPLILDFIKQIAIYENMLDKVNATEESLKESIFDNNRAEAIFIELDNDVIGYIIYYFNFSTFAGREGLYLEDLYIKPDYRKKGIGKKAFKFLAEIAKENKCGRMEWTCLDWNKSSLDFYKSIGANQKNEWILHRLEKEGIERLAESEA